MVEQKILTDEEQKTEKNFREEEIEFEVKGDKLRGTLFTPVGRGPHPAVVFYHGRNSSRQSYLPIGAQLAENGITAFCFDFRGHGESEGDPEKIQIEDLWLDTTKAFDFLRKRSGVEYDDEGNYGLCGVSMGGDFAATLAGIWSQNVKSLVLRAPTAYTLETGTEPIDTLGRILKLRRDWKAARVFNYVKHFQGELLIVASQNDEEIPQALIQDYLDHAMSAKEKEVYMIKGTGHNLGDVDSPARLEFKKVVVDWFKNTLVVRR